jgi:broad specificity phosphatase PhoE
MASKIILLRHGISHGNVDRKSYEDFPDYAIRLTKKGAEQARGAGSKLKEIAGDFDVYVSDYFRTRATFDYLQETLGENRVNSVKYSHLIREQEWCGSPKPYDDVGDEWRNKIGSFYYRFEHGESGADTFNRMLIFHELKVLPLIKSGGAENILIVAHGYSLRIYLKILLDLNVQEFEMIRNMKNCEIIQLSIEENGQFKLDSQLNIRPKRVAGFHYDKNDLA